MQLILIIHLDLSLIQFFYKLLILRKSIDSQLNIIFNIFIYFNFYFPSKKVLVDISSGAKRSGGETWGVYCSTKAAGVILHESIGKEEPEDKCKVLSYSPGIMRTDMQSTIAQATDSSMKQFLGQVLSQNKEVPIKESVDKLLSVLSEDTFKVCFYLVKKTNFLIYLLQSGDFVDIYDSRGPPLS